MNLLISLFYILSGILGIISVAIISMRSKTNRIINIYLIVIFSLLSVKFFLNGLNGFGILMFLDHFHSYYIVFFPIAFPSLYLYFKNLVADKKIFDPKELKHFIFPILLGLGIIVFDNFSIFSFSSRSVFYLIFFLFHLFYLFLCFNFLQENIWFRKTEVITVKVQNQVLKDWTVFLFVVSCLMSIRLLIVLFIEIEIEMYSFGQNYQWISVLLFDFIFFKILSTPEILYGYNDVYKKIKENRASNYILKDFWIIKIKEKIVNGQDLVLHEKISEFIPVYLSDIENLVLKHEIFRKSSVTINDIANKLEIPKSHITFVFKYHSKVSFTDFKKIIRIYDAINLIEKDYIKSNTLDSLAAKVGFSSYNPFFITFKEITGTTPQLYSKGYIKK